MNTNNVSVAEFRRLLEQHGQKVSWHTADKMLRERRFPPATIIVIPDTQAKPGVPTDHLEWASQYIKDRYFGKPDVIVVHLGDHADMSSLSSYDRPGSKTMEGKRYIQDIAAANDAFDILCDKWEDPAWTPQKHFLLGNHEDRISRAIESDPRLEGALSLDHLNYKAHNWEVHPFLDPIDLYGISFSHYFVNNANGRPVSGMIETRIKTIGTSFVQGHQQGLKSGMVETLAGRRRGIVAGSFYLHAETYRGPQAAGEWRGLIVLSDCYGDGDYNLMEVSVNYLARRFTGVNLNDYMMKKYKRPMGQVSYDS